GYCSAPSSPAFDLGDEVVELQPGVHLSPLLGIVPRPWGELIDESQSVGDSDLPAQYTDRFFIDLSEGLQGDSHADGCAGSREDELRRRNCLTSSMLLNFPPKCRTAWQLGQTGHRSLIGSTR